MILEQFPGTSGNPKSCLTFGEVIVPPNWIELNLDLYLLNACFCEAIGLISVSSLGIET